MMKNFRPIFLFVFLVLLPLGIYLILATPNAPLVEKLMNMSEIHLMNFKSSESYKQYFFKQNKYYEIVELNM